METLAQLINKIDFLSSRDVKGILSVIINSEGITNTKLIQTTGLPRESLRKFKTTLAYIFEDTSQDSIKIREEYAVALRNELDDIKPWRVVTYTDYKLTSYIENIRKELEINPNRDIDQFFALPQSTAAKCLLITDKIDLKNAHIALLGDDDLVSLGLNKLNNSTKKLTVFDIDTNLLESLKTINAKENYSNSTFVRYDVRDDLPREYAGNYDVVVTDPPYTKVGIALFLNRALELLGSCTDKSPKYIFLFWGNSFKSPEKTLKIQEIISSMNLLIEERFEKFAQYIGAESIGNNSAAYVLKVTPFTCKSNLPVIEGALYTHESEKEEKFPFVDHVTAKLYNVPKNIVHSHATLGKSIENFCKHHKLKVVDSKITRFKGEGLTLTFVLSNSNLVIHTWPELNAIHVDLITCSPIYDKASIATTLAKYFGTKSVLVNFIE